MTFRLPSPPGATLWTTTTMDKVLREAAPPTQTGDAISISAARNELEPFQVVVRADAAGQATLAMTPFTGPGSLDRIELRRVGYVTISEPSDGSSILSGQMPDPLEPSAFGASEAVPAGQNQPFWITVHVPTDAKAGDYTSTLTVTAGGASQAIPVKLHVFDFALPKEIGFDGNWNSSFEALGGSESLEAVQKLKDFFFEHRLVPSGVAWPAGLNFNGGIEYDCASGTFKQEDNAYDFSQLGPKYIDGTGWNGTGFPSFEIMQFVNNSTPRPQNFCGVDRGPDHFGTAEYNAAWSKLLAAIDAYLVARGWEDKGYYYVQNEPQDQADYDVAAFLANLSKAAAPHLRIAVSEEPKPEIAEHPSANGHSYDLWWADLSEFDPVYAAQRQAAGDTVWWYFLYGDLPPHFNPITIDHPGLESRIAFWAAWKFRVRGFAYYSVTGWGLGSVRQSEARGHQPERRRLPALSAEERRARHEHSLGAPARGSRGLGVRAPRRGRERTGHAIAGLGLRRYREQRRVLSHFLHARRERAAASSQSARIHARGQGRRLPRDRFEACGRARTQGLVRQLPGSRGRAEAIAAGGRRPRVAEDRVGRVRRGQRFWLVRSQHRQDRYHVVSVSGRCPRE